MTERPLGAKTAEPIRVVLVDDHTLLRQGLRHSLQELGIHVVGEASNGQAGVRLVGELRPDVVVMDLHMPQMDGIQAVRQVLAADPDARVIMLTISTEEDDVLAALTAGACGYVLKTAPPEDVDRAIRAAHAGDGAIAPEVTARLIARLRQDPAPTPPPDPPPLTPRELEILRLIADGKENAEIAQALVISPSTAKNHVASVLEKLGVDNRVQAAVYAVRAGIV